MQRARILVVDDERPSVEIITRVLEANGHSVKGAGSAEEALEMLAGDGFDLVLLDLVLPGQTGLQALGRMRELTRAPIHIMSGQTDTDTEKDSLLLGAAGFIPKPLELQALAALVNALPRRNTLDSSS